MIYRFCIESIYTLQHSVHLRSTDDPSIGRVGYASLSQQTLMELFVQDVTDENTRTCFQSLDGEYKPIEEWDGVIVDANGEVQSFGWVRRACGKLHFEYLPDTVTNVTIVGSRVKCTVPWGALPESLRVFAISLNGLEGSVRMNELPQKLRIFNMSSNKFSGSLMLEALPRALETLKASRNNFSGTVNLTNIPESCVSIDASFNSLTGAIDISALPQTFAELYLRDNEFSGALRVPTFPRAMKRVTLENNLFAGEVVIGELPESLESFSVSSKSPLWAVDVVGKPFADHRVLLMEYEELYGR